MPLPKAVTPSPYQISAQQLERRRAIANMLMQQGLSPIEQQMSGTARNPVAVRTSPLQVLGKLASAYAGSRMNAGVDRQYDDIAREMSTKRNAALQQMGPQYAGAQGALDAGVDPAIVGASIKPESNQPQSVREYEYAKQTGFTGSFQDWIKAGGQSSRPSPVVEWEFYNSLPPEMQQRYLEMKRNPNMIVKDVNQVPTVIHPTVGGTTTTPLSSLGGEAAAASTIKGAEAEGAATGKARGEVTGGIITKGANATGVGGLLDIADPLIDVATGSAGGAATDRVASWFGHATSGAEAIAQLKVLEAALIQNMPRLEGPQSDADKVLYQEAAGRIGNPNVPAAIKKAALQVVRQIQERYQQRAAALNPGASSAQAPAPQAPAPSAPQQSQSFASKAEAQAAAAAGTLQVGTKIVVNGVSGTWQ